jgi:hypothetical protein
MYLSMYVYTYTVYKAVKGLEHTSDVSAVTPSSLSSLSLPSFKISLSSPLSVEKPANTIVDGDGNGNGDGDNGVYSNSITTYWLQNNYSPDERCTTTSKECKHERVVKRKLAL